MRNPRYPGPKPFQAQEHALFFGRDKEIGDLYRLVGTNKITVLFGKSGFGKSSLLQAGLMPQLIDNQWISVQIRFGLYDKRRDLSLCDLLKKQLAQHEKLQYTEGGHFLENGTLWHEFKKRHDESKAKTALVFDQFEEFFSYPVEQQEAFQRELADVLYTPMPQKVVDAYENAPFEQQSYLATPMDIRALFAIRADRLSLLHGLKNYLPAILYARYELKGLTPEQARQAIEKPAAEIEGTFDSPPFAYEPAALDWITEQLSASKINATTEPYVEAVQLQIICQDIENQIFKGSLKSPVSKDNLPKFDAILENYYRQEIAELDPVLQYPARIIVEEKLISGQFEDGTARRATVDGSILAQEMGVEESLLFILVDVHLLRREPNSVGDYSYEICHDTLLEPILTARKERQTEEARIAEAKRQAVEAQKTADERRTMQQKLDEEKRKRLLANRLAAVFIGIAVLFIGLAAYAYFQFKKAQVSSNVAQVSNYLLNHEPWNALNLARWALEENETPQTEKALGDAFYAFLDETDGYLVQKIEAPKEEKAVIKAAAFTERGQKVELQFDSTAVIWDLKTGLSKTIKMLNKRELENTTSIFDGQLTVEKMDATTFAVIDGRQKPTFRKEFNTNDLIVSVSISADGTRILICHLQNVSIWFWQSQALPRLKGHGSDVNTVGMSLKKTLLLTASNDHTARIWGRNGDSLAVLRGHRDEVRSAIFANDDAYVLTASRDSFLRVWHWADSQLIDSVKLTEHPHRIAMSTDGQYVLVNLEANEPLLLSFSNGRLQPLVKNEGQIDNISWQPYMKDSAPLPPSGKKGNNVVFSNDGRLVAVVSNDIVQILNLKGAVIAEYKNPKGFSDVLFSPDNQYFIVAFGNESAVLPLPRTVHKWLITNGFPKVASMK